MLILPSCNKYYLLITHSHSLFLLLILLFLLLNGFAFLYLFSFLQNVEAAAADETAKTTTTSNIVTVVLIEQSLKAQIWSSIKIGFQTSNIKKSKRTKTANLNTYDNYTPQFIIASQVFYII